MLLRRVFPFALALAGVGCQEKRTSLPARPQPPPPPSASGAPSAAPSVAAAPPADAGPYEGPFIESTVLQAPIWTEMDFPERHGERETKSTSTRLGYMRYGEKAPVIQDAHTKPNCPEGWYELVAGGFVCGKYVTLDLDHPKLKQIKPPDLDGPLPYTYGINVANGTPLYRQIPSHAQRVKLEPWLFRPRKAKASDDEASAAAIPDAGAGGLAIGEDASDAGPDTPWWEREVPDGGPPSITLEDLQETGPVARRMVKGFYLSLDHQLDAAGARWWKTVGGLTAPADRIIIAKPITDYHGVWLGKDEATFPTKNVPARRIDKLPVGFVLWPHARKWTLDADHKHATVAEGILDRFDAVGLTGETARVAGYDYWETDDGWWLRSTDATRTEPGKTPIPLGEHEKWIDVNLKRQTLVAFEGTTAVFATLVSSGRNEHETPPGSFHIREKHIAATMDGDADTAADGPYSIEDVPYIEYFNAGYALHGAFWHAAFGFVKSHGCVNLAPWDAKALFGWTDPQLPDGWHAVYASKDHPGTRVIVHERGPGTCEGPKAEPPQCP
ncbi:MAG TPA: L,D-transpeptidase [Polyangiaceae bacterium]|nr:L,D-transpeptidase [Polyangiaceae bacterium]